MSNDIVSYKIELEHASKVNIQIFPLPLEGQIFTTVIKSTLPYPSRISEAARTNYKIEEKEILY